MTPTEMLEPQPSPDGDGYSITDAIPQQGAVTPLVGELLKLRRQQGVERYGTELRSGNGRRARVDALQEALDLVVYLYQDHVEGTLGTPHWDDLPRELRVAIGLASALAHQLRDEP